MMRLYLWYNEDTKEMVEHTSPDTPPNENAGWVRRYSVGIGRVEGGGGSPARTSK